MRDSRTPRLRHMLTELRSVQADSAWVSETRAQLLEKIGGAEVVHVSFVERVRMVVGSFIPTPARSVLRGPIAAVLSGLALIVGGSMASVSAAEQSVPGDLLFPVKLVSEQTRMALATDKREKVRLKGEFVNRRVDEIKKIAQTDVEKKPERLKEATEILRRDLDTVRNQLSDVSSEKPSERVEVARLIDKASTDAAAGLKEAKAALPVESRPQVTEVEVAAVNASVKAVNVIIDSQINDEDAKKVVSKEELLESINQKVEGVSDHITSATQQLTSAGILSASGTAVVLPATSTVSLGVSTSSVADLLSANASLAQARQLLLEDRLSEVGDKLIEASKSASNAEKTVEAASSSTSTTIPTATTTPAVTTTTPSGTTTTTSAVTIVTTTSPATPPASTTPMTPPSTTQQKK